MDDKTKIRILKTAFVASQVGWVIAVRIIRREDFKQRNYMKLYEFADLLLKTIEKENPELLRSEELQNYITNDKFEKIVEGIKGEK